ncbi:MAG: hypothetical protein JWM11_2022 [Planctomycetaceae bacterium]|nr:hypothetical protein [Planctomycetaceae bacterium]
MKVEQSMRKVNGYALWIGNAGDLRDARTLLTNEIEAVIELGDSEPFAVLPRELIRCRFPLSDGGDNPAWLLRLATESVAAMIRAKVPVIVCCSAGMSRSVSVAAGALALADGHTLTESLSVVVGNGPADISPGLWAQLESALGL